MMISFFRLFLVVVVVASYYCSGSTVFDHQDETNENLLDEMSLFPQPQQSLRGGGRETIEEERHLSRWSTHPRNCPVFKCAAPCLDDTCGPDEICRTKTRSTWNRGQRCPGCPVFDKCIRKKPVDEPIPSSIQCGPTTCLEGLVCCNASCGICTPPDGACTQQACIIDDPTPTSCGSTTCGDGLVCCNASCGICTPPDGACTQQACDVVSHNDNAGN